jgi:hypothetical protein
MSASKLPEVPHAKRGRPRGFGPQHYKEVVQTYANPCPQCGGSKLVPGGECRHLKRPQDAFDAPRLHREAIGFYLFGQRFLYLTDDFARAVSCERSGHWEGASMVYQVLVNSVLLEGDNPSLRVIGHWLPPTETGKVQGTGNVANFLRRFCERLDIPDKRELRKMLLRGLTHRQGECMARYLNPGLGAIGMDGFEMRLLFSLSVLPAAS